MARFCPGQPPDPDQVCPDCHSKGQWTGLKGSVTTPGEPWWHILSRDYAPKQRSTGVRLMSPPLIGDMI
jgi:hypothetical protein